MIKITEEHDSKIHKGAESESNALFSKQQKYKKKIPASGINSNKRNDKNETSSRPPVKYRCAFCKRKGHKTEDCFHKQKADTQNANAADELFYVKEDATAESTYNAVSNTRWCIDSGCTSHLCKESELFKNTQEINSGINLASDATATVTAKGDVQIKVSNDKQDKSITLQNALYVPTLRTNLLSVAKIVDKRHQVLFTENRAYVQDSDGNVKMIADRVGNLFYLREGHDTACTASTTAFNDAKEWHQRLGHLDWRDMLFMLRNEVVTGLKFKASDIPHDCDICTVGKMATLPFPKGNKRTKAPLEIVHTDLCGPMRTESQGGARYILTFTDDYSRWTEVYFLKNKSEVSIKFLEYKNYAETSTGKRIKALQSDNGKEFCNSIMENILKQFGIRRRLSAPYTPQQNGIAERKNRTLIESARCMLEESGLPKSFWAEAVATANHVRNRCVTKILGKKTPHEMWTGKRPNVNHLQKFGVGAYVLDKTPNKDKLAPRGVEGIFVGYSETSKAYRIWIPAERKVRVTRDIKFKTEFGINKSPQLWRTIQGIEIERRDPHSQEPQNATILNETQQDDHDPSHDDIEKQVEISDVSTINEIPVRRAPGRPRKAMTGKPRRPAKIYNTVPAIANTHESKISSDTSEDDNLGWHDAEFAMNAHEIPLLLALSGPEKDEWQDAIHSEIRSLVLNDTFDIVARPADKKVIKSRTVLQ